MAKKNFTVVFPIKADGKQYKPGETIQLDPKEAEVLVRRGVLSAGKKEPVEANPGMPEPKKGEPKPPENTTKQQTADPAENPGE